MLSGGRRTFHDVEVIYVYIGHFWRECTEAPHPTEINVLFVLYYTVG